MDLSSRKAGGNDVFEGQAVEYKMVSKQEQDISGQSEGSALNFAQPIMDEAVIPGVCQGHKTERTKLANRTIGDAGAADIRLKMWLAATIFLKVRNDSDYSLSNTT